MGSTSRPWRGRKSGGRRRGSVPRTVRPTTGWGRHGPHPVESQPPMGAAPAGGPWVDGRGSHPLRPDVSRGRSRRRCPRSNAVPTPDIMNPPRVSWPSSGGPRPPDDGDMGWPGSDPGGGDPWDGDHPSGHIMCVDRGDDGTPSADTIPDRRRAHPRDGTWRVAPSGGPMRGQVSRTGHLPTESPSADHFPYHTPRALIRQVNPDARGCAHGEEDDMRVRLQRLDRSHRCRAAGQHDGGGHSQAVALTGTLAAVAGASCAASTRQMRGTRLAGRRAGT